MFYCAAFFTLLVLTWAGQANSYTCNGKPLSHEQSELFALLDRSEAAMKGILQSPHHKEMIKELNKKMKSAFCDMDINGNILKSFKSKHEAFLKHIKEGNVTENVIIDVLNKDPITNFNAFFKKMIDAIKNEA